MLSEGSTQPGHCEDKNSVHQEAAWGDSWPHGRDQARQPGQSGARGRYLALSGQPGSSAAMFPH